MLLLILLFKVRIIYFVYLLYWIRIILFLIGLFSCLFKKALILFLIGNFVQLNIPISLLLSFRLIMSILILKRLKKEYKN